MSGNEELLQAIYWYNRVKQEECRLDDMCIGKVKQHVGTILKHIGNHQPRAVVYRAICPSCGSAISLEKDT